MSLVHLSDLGIPRNQPKKRTGLCRNRRSGFGKHGEWKETGSNHAHTAIHLQIQQTLQARVLDRHGSSTSAPPTPQRPVPVEHGTQEVKPGFTLGTTRGKLLEDMSWRDFFQIPYGDYQGLESQQEIQTHRREGSQK
ncbi:hypothetical protein O181_054594 [Austropuccinia psidii MF-1]|uniref:Uncharacterized protein n=1 Tax=Austropuccinia psidii MF-1 TaxID=1389203 RepID=A0A9Q3E4X9_9BASI|nr:hypothetical protein [Austropuccinia psidii MF-1]